MFLTIVAYKGRATVIGAQNIRLLARRRLIGSDGLVSSVQPAS
jgi:hypothetical protein